MLTGILFDELKDICRAEKHIVKTLSKMQKAATSEELRMAFINHLEKTKENVTRLEQVFQLLGKKHNKEMRCYWRDY